MYAINKKTRSPITGTLEQIEGTCRTVEDSFKRLPNGRLGYDHQGGTDIYWDTVTTTSNVHGTRFVDRAGDAVNESDIELVTTNPAEARPPTPENPNPEPPESAKNHLDG